MPNPSKTDSPQIIDLKTFEDRADDETDVLFFWVREVREAPEPTPAPTQAPTPTPAMQVKSAPVWRHRAPPSAPTTS